MLGMHGSAAANYAIQNADLIIAIGARFDDRVTGRLDGFAPEARKAHAEGRGGIIHFEVSPKSMNKVVECTVSVLGDCKVNMTRLIPEIGHAPRTEWMNQISQWKQDHKFDYCNKMPEGILKPQRVIEELDVQSKGKKDKIIISTGVGQHQMWAAQFYRWTKSKSMITSGGLGTMGFGLPAAIGCQVALPDHIVIDIDGDGSFSMTAMELVTAVQYNIPVKVCNWLMFSHCPGPIIEQ